MNVTRLFLIIRLFRGILEYNGEYTIVRMRQRLSIIGICVIFVLAGGSALKYALTAAGRNVARWNICVQNNGAQAENNALREKISALTVASGVFTPQTVVANVYASYPFNNQNTITIDVGSDRGMQHMMPATMGGVILVGQVTKVFAHQSMVRMMTSPDVQMPVRIGPRAIPGLLIGGPQVRVEMIPQNKKIAVGDSIIAASLDAPYGLKIGTVESFRADTQTGVFQEAMVALGYDPYTLTTLTLLLWAPR